MKTLSSICEKELASMKDDRVILCDYVMTPAGPTLMNEPVLAHDYVCGYCNGKSHYCPCLDPRTSDKKVWLCANVSCDVYKRKSYHQATTTPAIPKRALEWPVFCEINGIGNVHHEVKFEKIDQSKPKIEYLLKFGTKPSGIIFMQGTAGSGKTYACMGVCEYYTRRNTSCMFSTQRQMMVNWIAATQPGQYTNYVERVTSCNLLVVDDFGTGDVSPGFMAFFMDLINTRMQWTDRGTIITTNLPDREFTSYCGAALNDRIKTGQKFVFNEKTRRVPTVL